MEDDERKMSQLLGIMGIDNKRMIEAVKKFFVDVWRVRKSEEVLGLCMQS